MSTGEAVISSKRLKEQIRIASGEKLRFTQKDIKKNDFLKTKQLVLRKNID